MAILSKVSMFERFACGGERWKLMLKSSPLPSRVEIIVLSLSQRFVVLGFSCSASLWPRTRFQSVPISPKVSANYYLYSFRFD